MQHVSAPSGVAIIFGRSTATIRDFRIEGPVRPPQGGVPNGGAIQYRGYRCDLLSGRERCASDG